MKTKIIKKYRFQDPATKERYVREVHQILRDENVELPSTEAIRHTPC